MKFHLRGVLAAIWTPADASGTWLPSELADQVRFLNHCGVDGFMALGSTGQFLHFDPGQRQAILECVLKQAAGRTVIANISEVRPAVAAALGKHAGRSGAAAVAILPPYFYPVRQPDLLEFFLRTAGESGLPCVLYNFPERTGTRISLETAAAAADRLPLAAIKLSGQEFDYHKEMVALGREKGFSVLTGLDTRLADALALGASGCISGLANAVPEWLLQGFQAFVEGKLDLAEALSTRMQQLAAILGPLPFPCNVAAAMVARGRPIGESKLPMSSETVELFANRVKEATAFYRRFGLETGSANFPVPTLPPR